MAVAFRPLESLKETVCAVDESGALAAMERWTVGATVLTGVSAKTIFGSSRVYVQLASIVEAEGLSGGRSTAFTACFHRIRCSLILAWLFRDCAKRRWLLSVGSKCAQC